MNKHIFKSNFKTNFKSFSIWSGITAAMVALILFLYPLYKDIFDSENLPEAFLELFPGLDFDSIANYFAFEVGTTLIIVGGIYAALLGMNLLRKELKDESGQILYTYPVSRMSIVMTKLFNLIVNIMLFNILMTVVSFSTMIIVDDGATFEITNFLIYMGMLSLIILSIGLLSFSLTAFFKSKTSTGLNIGLVMLFFIIATISGIAEEVEFLKYFSPFSYFLLEPTIMTDGLVLKEVISTFIWIGFSFFLTVVSILNFKRTDIL